MSLIRDLNQSLAACAVPGVMVIPNSVGCPLSFIPVSHILVPTLSSALCRTKLSLVSRV